MRDGPKDTLRAAPKAKPTISPRPQPRQGTSFSHQVAEETSSGTGHGSQVSDFRHEIKDFKAFKVARLTCSALANTFKAYAGAHLRCLGPAPGPTLWQSPPLVASRAVDVGSLAHATGPQRSANATSPHTRRRSRRPGCPLSSHRRHATAAPRRQKKTPRSRSSS